MTDFDKYEMQYSFYLMLLLFISCEGKLDKTDSDYFSGLQFSLDTVIIDPGDEILQPTKKKRNILRNTKRLKNLKLQKES